MTKKFMLFTFLLLVAAGTYAQKSWVAFSSNEPAQSTIHIQQSDRAGMTVEITVPGMYRQQITEGEMVFDQLSLTAGATTQEVGLPELPMLSQVIGVPGNQKVSFKIIEQKTQRMEGYNVYPFQTPTTDNPGGHDHPFVMNENFYNQNRIFPGVNVQMDAPQVWRDVKLTNLHVTPFSYNPATQTLEVITHLIVAIEFEGNDNSMTFNPRMQLSPKFYNMYKSAIPNFETLGYTLSLRETPGIKYLVITNEEALDAIQPLVDWKNQMGHRVEVRTLETGFTTPQQFKTYITGLYETDGLEYVLMVGDAYPNGGSGGGPNVVPMYYWNPGGDASYSDSWYTCLDGPNDHFADLAIGRFVYDANQINELEIQIEKTMTHYLSPDMSGNWGENTILVANKEEYPGKYTQCCNEIAAFNYGVQTPIFEKAYGGEGYSNANVVEFVNASGSGIFNYRGHGSATELWNWTNSGPTSFTAAHVSQLNNVDQLFVFFDVCCDNMDIVAHAGECLCESFMKHPTASVAVNGAIIPSYTIPNHDYDKEMYKAIFNENITNIGYITNYANLTVLNVHGEIGKSNVRTYLWLGDASIEPWTKQIGTLTVSHDAQLFLGMSEFTVTISGSGGSAENAMVCVSNEDQSIYAVGYADASGVAVVTFDSPVIEPGNVNVTVSLHNYLPYQASVPVIPQEGPYVVKDSYVINDNAGGNGNGMMDYAEQVMLSLSVKNVGIQTANNVTVTISTEDEYITITDATEVYGNIEPDEILTVADGFAFDVAEDLPDGHSVLINVSAGDGTDTWASTIVIPGHAPDLVMQGFEISDITGNNNGKLDPGEEAQIIVTLANEGSADAFLAIGEMIFADPYLTLVNTQPQEFGDIAAGGTAIASFTVSADMATPAGHMVQLTLQAEAEHNITAQGEFMVVIGQIPVVIIDLDENHNSGTVMAEVLDGMGISADYFTTIPNDLNLYSSAFVCLGIYSNNHTLSSSEGDQLADFLNLGGSLYMEGGDTWYYDSPTAVHPMFHINGTSDGSGDLGTINGVTGTFTEGMTFSYSGDNSWVDRLAPLTDAEVILTNASPAYNTAIAYDADDYKTIGASSEFGGLAGNDATGEELMAAYLNFFGVINTTLTANFLATTTELCEDLEVSFTDFSSGAITEWYWEFEGGTPATSSEESPTVMYEEGGDFDVTLTITGEQGTNSITKSDYIHVMFMPVDASSIEGSTQTCQGYEETFTVDMIEHADTYNWVLTPSEAGEVTVTDNSITILISLEYAGDANLKVCGGNNCGDGGWSDAFVFTVNTCVGIFDGQSSAKATVYPNPAEGLFTIELTGNDVVRLQVINAIGEVIYMVSDVKVVDHLTTDINLNGFAEGVYYLQIDGNTMHAFQKIVIAR
ncbi:MAG: T9SS type A sorting domain-containing protein [Clostridia bacterium]|nr:T9SS type A sorting domain-containing protein [Clostridia bacterium]